MGLGDISGTTKLDTATLQPDVEREFWAIVSALGRPKSYLDIGCGNAVWVRAAYNIGARPAVGIGTWEGRFSAIQAWKRSRILTRDVAAPFHLDCQLTCRFALVTALRVPVLPANLVSHVLPDGYIVVNDRAQCELDLELNRRATERVRAALGSSSYKVYFGA